MFYIALQKARFVYFPCVSVGGLAIRIAKTEKQFVKMCYQAKTFGATLLSKAKEISFIVYVSDKPVYQD